MSQSPLRVAVVDDNEDAAWSLAFLLRLQGYEVVVANNGAEGWRIACDWSPDVMLLDIAMPKLDGYQLAQQIRQHPRCQDVRLLAVTGFGDEAHCQEGLQAGFDHYLVKPVDPILLIGLLADLQRRKDAANEQGHNTG